MRRYSDVLVYYFREKNFTIEEPLTLIFKVIFLIFSELVIFYFSKGSTSKVKPENYTPSKSKYHPINDACWVQGQKYWQYFTVFVVFVNVFVSSLQRFVRRNQLKLLLKIFFRKTLDKSRDLAVKRHNLSNATSHFLVAILKPVVYISISIGSYKLRIRNKYLFLKNLITNC